MNPFPLTLSRPLLVFTDLDGTLLDHHTYTWEQAAEGLSSLARHRVPLVFCSSKTFAEQVFLQKQLGIFQPFIFENGSAVAAPEHYFPPEFRKDPHYRDRSDGYDIWVFAHADIDILRAELANFPAIKGFSDVTDAELSAATGLHGPALQRARDRWFTETLLSLPNRELLENLDRRGFRCSRGGRFFSIQPMEADKGKAAAWLTGIFRKMLSAPPLTAAIGDSANDAPLLAAVDFPFLVRRPDGKWLDQDLPGVLRVDGIGPAGFSKAVAVLLGKR